MKKGHNTGDVRMCRLYISEVAALLRDIRDVSALFLEQLMKE